MKDEFSKYKYKIETHAHTSPVSKCSEVLPEDLVKLYDSINFAAIVITNHLDPSCITQNVSKGREIYLNDFENVKKYAQKTNINIILGMEIRFTQNDNDYLVYGIDEEFIENSFQYLQTDIKTFYINMKNDKNIILQAHPFRNNMTLAPREYIDGIETFNMHLNHNSRVAQACKYANSHKEFLTIAGTDFHHVGHEGGACIIAKTLPKNSFEFAQLIKSRDYLFNIGGNIVFPYGKYI